jgi:hypothetical protein
MRRALLFSPLLISLLIALAAACGGSSSETPWPVEPDPSQLGPSGENAIPTLVDDDAGRPQPKKP